MKYCGYYPQQRPERMAEALVRIKGVVLPVKWCIFTTFRIASLDGERFLQISNDLFLGFTPIS